MISRKSIDEVLERARIEEVVQDFVTLRRKGSNMTGLCPFHHEKTPSFNVSPTRNIFKCFGCGKGGDSVKFVMEHEGYDFPETIRYLATKYGIQLEETKADAESIQAEKERESIYHVLDFAWQFYKKQLFHTEEGQVAGLSYFQERGFRTKTIETFGLGYAPEGNDNLVKEALKNGFTRDTLSRAGLATQHGSDFFRGRAIFPIFNISGKVIAFAGRQLTNDKRSPKYINSPETEIYNKRKVLYGLAHAKKAIRQEDNCYLVEGYTDVISMFQSGIENVVASSGTALTPDQTRLIRRYAGKVTVLYDSDPAGIKAAMRGLDLILEENLDVKLALLPEGEDPDSFVKKEGMAGFNEFILKNSKDFILFKTGLLLKEAGNDPMKRTALIKDLVETLAHIPEAIKRATFITECAHLMRIDEHILIRETNKAFDELLRQRRQGATRNIESERDTQWSKVEPESQQPSEATVISFPELTDHYQERDIVRILLNYGVNPIDKDSSVTVTQYVVQNLLDVLEHMQHPLYKKIVVEYKDVLETGRQLNALHFIKHKDREIQALAIELLTFPFEYASWDEHDIPLQVQLHPDDNFKKDALHAILRLKLQILMQHIDENNEAIAALPIEGSDEEIAILLRLHNDLIRMREQITSQFKSVVLKV
jgi:DNA primase